MGVEIVQVDASRKADTTPDLPEIIQKLRGAPSVGSGGDGMATTTKAPVLGIVADADTKKICTTSGSGEQVLWFGVEGHGGERLAIVGCGGFAGRNPSRQFLWKQH